MPKALLTGAFFMDNYIATIVNILCVLAVKGLLCKCAFVTFSAKRIKLVGLMERIMNILKNSTLVLLIIGALSACGNMSQRDKNTAAGAGIGGVAGAVLTGGALGTVGGAAVGGVIGNQIGK